MAVDLRVLAAQDARRAGIDPNVFVRQIGAESNFNPNARSPAGAQGIAQIVPRWHPGVNTSDPVASLAYAANLMGQLFRKYGNYRDALSVYNSGRPFKVGHGFAETRAYVDKILGARGGATPAQSVAAGVPSSAPAAAAPAAGAMVDPRAAMVDAVRQQVLQYGSQGLSARLPGILAAVRQQQALQGPQATGGAGAQAMPSGAAVGLPGMPGGQLVGHPLDRAGVPTLPTILGFARRVAGTYGHPITLGTGTSHREYVQGEPGVVSAHWTGHALDLPATGAQLTAMGQAALIAAGMPPAQARKQTGGVFNVGGYNILFNTDVGGNHFNHLHVGERH